MRVRYFAVRFLAALAVTATLAAQDGARARYEAALEAWHAGAYPDALVQLRALIDGPGGDAWVEPVALLTGEFYRSIEISPADRLVVALAGPSGPEWSPDGRHLAFESAAGFWRTIHLFRLDAGAPRPLDPIDGFGATFSFDGARVAFLRIVEDDPLRAARAAGGRGAGAGPAGRGGGPPLADLEAARTAVVERDLVSGRETIVTPPGGMRWVSVHYATGGQLFLTGGPIAGAAAPVQVYRATASAIPAAVTSGAMPVRVVQPLAGGRLLVAAGTNAFGILEPAGGGLRTFEAVSYAAADGGDAVVYLTQADGRRSIRLVRLAADATPQEIRTSPLPLAGPAISADGRTVAFQMMPREDWEIYTIDLETMTERRVTHEIQHDHTARFLAPDRLLAVMGESRHRRSYVYDLATGVRRRLFHNNTLRTVSMEQAWMVSPDGTRVLIVADRDGDTISPERGVYLMDLTSTVSRQEVRDRLTRELAAENDLRERGRRMYAAMADQVREAVREVSGRRIYEHERSLGAFGSKYMTEPGNQQAAEYLHATLASYGYAPEYQYFEVTAGRGRPPIRTANVIATLRGTAHPELEYLVSSHFDSVTAGPGADDNTSGTAALLEVARMLRDRPMPATVRFLWFTGEEAGLLGSREYVRQAQARGDRVLGALNNDMVGFSEDGRLDDTIRYSNPGLRDLQHAAAFLFTNLVTYDARYYLSTDAASFYDAYGDVVAGIGSHPILGNPHYHQAHDTLDTVSIPLITEVAKTTAASIMLMASSPSRLQTVMATATSRGAEITWTPSPERDVAGYLVRAWVNGQPRDTRVTGTRAEVAGLRPGDEVRVKAVNRRGMEGWDWQRAVVR